MALQLSEFKPLAQQHYQLATTQDERDAEMQRQMALDNNKLNAQAVMANMQEANQNSRTGASLAEQARQHDIQAGLSDARLQQDADNAAANRDYQNRSLSLSAKAQERQDERADTQNKIGLAELALRKNADTRQQEEFGLKKHEADLINNIGNLGFAMSNMKPDEKGLFDITPHRDAVESLLGGRGATKDYAQITAQSIKKSPDNPQGKEGVQFYGIDKEGNQKPLSGIVDNGYFTAAMQHLGGKQSDNKYEIKTIKDYDKEGFPVGERVIAVDPRNPGKSIPVNTGLAAQAQPDPSAQPQPTMTAEQKAQAILNNPNATPEQIAIARKYVPQAGAGQGANFMDKRPK